MKSTQIYERFHKTAKIQNKTINDKNFTYRNLLSVINRYVEPGTRKILDIGCGVGTVSFYLANKGLNITGIDISQGAIEICKQSAKELGLQNKIQFKEGTIEQLRFKERFDLIICSEVLEHIPDDKKFLHSLYELLSRNGILILSVPSKNAPLYRLGFAKEFDKRVGHLRRYNVEEIIYLMEFVGFSIKDTTLKEGILRNFLFLTRFGWFIKLFKGVISDIVTKIDNLTLFLFGESQIFVVARK